MLYKAIECLKPSLFKRLTGVKKEVFAQMLDSVLNTNKVRGNIVIEVLQQN